MLTIGRIFAGNGWRYLWDQVAQGAEDYYLLDVVRGETPGRWGGSAAGPELGLVGQVTEEQMRRTFGRLAHPATDMALGRPPRAFKSLDERLQAARAVHERRETARWARREVDLAAAGAATSRIDAERAAHRQAADERWCEREAAIRRGGSRQAVAGFDLTFSPPKSVSVLWAAAPPEGRRVIWAAHHEGVAAAMGFVEREAALSRSGYGGVRQVDTTGLVTASFDHRMSRAGDVHIHTHTATLNRVRCADGQWRALDGRAVYRVAAQAGAIYDRVREAALERDLGVRHHTDPTSGVREIVGVDRDLRRLFSTRLAQVEGRVAELVEAWRAKHGTDPSPWTLGRMADWARIDTRAPKGPGETTASALDRWDAECRAELGRSLADVWAAATGTTGISGDHDDQSPQSDDDVLAGAVAAIDVERSTWTGYDLAREITRRLHIDPDETNDEALARVDDLVEWALSADNTLGVVSLAAPEVFSAPANLRRIDGESVYDEHGTGRYTTTAGIATEQRLLAAATDTTAPRIAQQVTESVIAQMGLDGDQAAAARQVLGSGRRIEAVVGPAGTGKTTAMGAIAQAWADAGGQVMGISISENASRVLSHQAGIQAVNAAKLIFEHTQRHPAKQRQPWWQRKYAVRAGALVILDEASMASRHVIDQIARICAAADAKLLLVGDPEQLDSPDTSGTFGLIARRTGSAGLEQVRRFHHAWEAAASLRLRAGDPTVLVEYDRRGRIRGGSAEEMEDAALAATIADMARGLAVFLLADTNQTAGRLAGRVRDHRVQIGQVDDTRTVTLADANRAGVGDHIVTRNNDRFNTTGDGRFVANRDTWTVTHVTEGDGLRVDRPDTGETVILEAGYVAEHVQLAYASTVHAAQGATRQVTHAVISERTDRHAAYVALTRGRQENNAYVVVVRPEGADHDGPPADPQAVLTDILGRDDPPQNAAALTYHADDAERAVSLDRLHPIWQDLTGEMGRDHAEAALAAICGPDVAASTIASPAWPALAARLWRIHAAGLDPDDALIDAAAAGDLHDAEDLAAVLHWRLADVETAANGVLGDNFTALTPTGRDQRAIAAAQIAAVMDQRTQQLALRVQSQHPAWAAQLGPFPNQPDQRADWLRRAGIVAGYREAFAHTHPDDPIGPPPAPGRAEAHAWWTKAAAALDRTEARTLAALPAEHLEAIIDQVVTNTIAAPASVADQLRQAAQALRQASTTEGAALAAGDHHKAARAHQQAENLAEQLASLETAQASRDQWTSATARLQYQADAARSELDARRSTRSQGPYHDTDTATLASWLKDARIRADRAQRTARKYEQWAERADTEIDNLNRQIVLAHTGPPNQADARQQILAEQQAAQRITEIEGALDATRLGYHSVRGQTRDRLASELAQLRHQHPALTAGDPQPRWDSLQAAATDADRQHLQDLHSRRDRARTDRTWYTRAAEQMRTDAEQQTATVTNIKAELTARTASSTSAPSARPAPRTEQAARTAPAEHLAYEQLTDTLAPPQDTIGPDL